MKIHRVTVGRVGRGRERHEAGKPEPRLCVNQPRKRFDARRVDAGLLRLAGLVDLE